MLSLIEQIKKGALWDFPGGVHPPENKSQSTQLPVASASIPDELILPLKQHVGRMGELLVAVGEQVKKGQPLTQGESPFMLPIHAPTSGIISAIEPRVVTHPSGLTELCIILTPDHHDQWDDTHPYHGKESFEKYLDEYHWQRESTEQLIEKIRHAGISGLGGAGFPTAQKLISGLQRTEILIVNAIECEPYITADDVLMRNYAKEIINGIDIVEHILKPQLTIIAIEDNKFQAIRALNDAACDRDFVIRVVPTKYPSGGEKQLIKLLTNKEVPSQGLPADIGIIMHNVSSIYAIQRAVVYDEPLTQRIVTLTGNAFPQPRNVWALLGTPISYLLSQYGYQANSKGAGLIIGGPMMGFSLPDLQAPITKTSNCILAPTTKELPFDAREMECIRCGQCASVCPMQLLPQQLQWHAKAKEYDKCEILNLNDCIECGACAYVCPSNIPLVHHYRQAKAEIKTRQHEAKAAERARVRFEEKKARLAREKAERDERFKKTTNERRQDNDNNDKEAIAAAIARVKAKQSTNGTPEKVIKPAVAAAIAKAKSKQAQANTEAKAVPNNTEMSALRQARKEQARKAKEPLNASQASNSPSFVIKQATPTSILDPIKVSRHTESHHAQSYRFQSKPNDVKQDSKEHQTVSPQKVESPNDKSSAIAAAVARAKARKAETAKNSSETDECFHSSKTELNDTEQVVTKQVLTEQTVPKKALVHAAIARAKARKAEAKKEPSTTTEKK